MILRSWQKFVLIPILILTILGPQLAPWAEGFSFPDRYDLVAILVEQEMYEDGEDYDGLPDEPDTNLKSRVDRYAEDLQNALPGTRAIIIQADRYEAPENIAAVLERLYFDGDPDKPGSVAYLRGLVAIGEVPLPVINKQGNRFVSLFPYTDFEQKAYMFSQKSGDFELSNENVNQQPEIWHGVIRPPISTKTPEGKNMLAAYLDKNHLYHVGDRAYTDFGKKIFFQDFVAEAKNVNRVAFDKYLNYAAHWAEVAYMRYTKEFYKDLSGPMEEELAREQAEAKEFSRQLENVEINGQRVPQDDTVPEPEYTAQEQEDLDVALEVTGGSTDGLSISSADLPDIQTKMGHMIDPLLRPFREVFTKYPHLVKDIIKYTGRYLHWDTAVNLITAKDHYTSAYLKAINNMVERVIDEKVALLQKPISFSRIEMRAIQVEYVDGDGNMQTAAPDENDAPFRSFVNFSPEDLELFEGPSDLLGSTEEEDYTLPDRLNGLTLNSIGSVKECTPYRGSLGTGRYSKLVEFNRALDDNTSAEFDPGEDAEDDPDEVPADRLRRPPEIYECDENAIGKTGRTKKEQQQGKTCFGTGDGDFMYCGNCQGYENFAGCFYDGSELFQKPDPSNDRPVCYPDRATDPVFIPSGTRRVPVDEAGAAIGLPENFDNFKTCLNFREEANYKKYIRAADEILENMDDIDIYEDYTDEPVYHKPAGRAIGITRLIQTADLGDILEDEDGNPIPFSPDTHPTGVILFKDSDIGVITLADVLQTRGWNLGEDYRPYLADLMNQAPQMLPPLAIDFPSSSGIRRVFLLMRFQDKREDDENENDDEPLRTLPSTFFHKEPTKQTLNAQAYAMSTRELPIDSPRYVTFQDFESGVARITYPDIFTESSFETFLQTLEDAENRLNAVPRDPSIEAPCENCLRDLFSLLSEEKGDPVGGDDVFVRANEPKVLDAILWKNLDIDSKHQYLLTHYVDAVRLGYVGESPNGYELAYINGEGAFDRYEFSITPQEEEKIPAEPLPPLPEPQDDPDNAFDEPVLPNTPQDGGYDLFSFSPPPISPWWDRMEEWMDDMEARVNDFEIGLGESEFYASLDSDYAAELERIRQESRDFQSSLSSGEPMPLTRISQISLETDSSVVVTNKRADIVLKVKDSEGQLVRDEFAKVTLTLEGEGRFSEDLKDAELETPGYQVGILPGGMLRFGIIAPENPQEIKLVAELADSDVKGELQLRITDQARISLQSDTFGIVADGENVIPINISALDENNEIITGANGTVRLGVLDPQMGEMLEKEVALVSGIAEAGLQVGKRKGKLIVNATSGSLDPGQVTINLLPGPAKKISLGASADTLPILPGASVELTATLFDVNGNMVDTNSSVNIDFALSEKTAGFGNLSSLSERVEDGVAQVTLRPTDLAGKMRIIASAPGLSEGQVIVRSVKQWSSRDVMDMQPDSLAVALLGIPAGDIGTPDFLGGWVVANGRTQAAVSLTASPRQYQKLFEVNDRGGITLPKPGRVSIRFLPANNFTMLLRDTKFQTDIAQVAIYTQPEGQFEVTEQENPAVLADGIYMRKLGGEVEVDRVKGSLRVVKEESERLEIQTNGFIRIFDNDFRVIPKPGNFLTLTVLEKTQPVAEIFIIQRLNQDVRVQPQVSEAPGVYVSPFGLPQALFYAPTFTGNSSSNPRGIAFFDKSEVLKGGSAPGFSFKSLEDSLDQFGVGFTEDNKFALLFAAGETFGEANRLYASDAGIVLGDPSIRVQEEAEPQNFGKDTGKMIYSGAAPVRNIINFDYDSDDDDDVLVAEGEGRVRLLQNNGGYDALKDQGYLFDIKSGIQDLAKADFNKDGQMDLVIAGSNPCRKGDTCLDVYKNNGGAFIRENIPFDSESGEGAKEKITTVRPKDLNRDGYPELVFADTAGNIKVLYNVRGTFDLHSELIGNVGLQVDPAKNLIQSVLVAYDDMDTKTDDPRDSQRFSTLSVREINPDLPPGSPSSINYVERDFLYADLDVSAFAGSTKFAEDLNGGVVRNGDKIQYTLTIQNDSGGQKRNVKISDTLSSQLEFDPASLKCLDCGEEEFEIEALTGHSSRPYLFKITRIPAGRPRHIQYEAVYHADLAELPKISLTFNNRFSDPDPNIDAALKLDEYPDISVTKTDNPTGRVLYLYTQNRDGDGRLDFGSTLSTEPAPFDIADIGIDTPSMEEINDFPKKCVLGGIFDAPILPPNGLPPFFVGSEENCEMRGGVVRAAGPSKIAQDTFNEFITKDSDGDGLIDSIDGVEGGLDDIAGATEAAVAGLTCSAGCIPMPFNYAFLAPGTPSVMGVPGGYDPGLPVFGWGAPSTPPIYPPAPYLSTSGGRFYVSPTLTGGVGFAVCLGPSVTPNNCVSFGINVLDLIPNLCDSINGAMGAALSAVNSAASDISDGMVLSLGGGNTTQTGSRDTSGSGMLNYSLGDYESPVSGSKNTRIPGFPSVLMDWFDRQTEEIINKATNMPDIYVIYPDPDTLIGEAKHAGEMFKQIDFPDPINGFLAAVNSLPLVDIETEDVSLSIPFLTRKEIEKLKADARQWLEDETVWLNSWKNIAGCLGGIEAETPGNFGNQELCRFVTAEVEGLRSSIIANMQALDEWIAFPKRLLQFRAIEAYYIGQLVSYLDTIIEFAGGWVKRNVARIQQWRRAVMQIKQMIQNWDGMIQLMVDYNESCDQCKSERYSLMEMILKIFMAIPSPPVIPLPKLPDIVVDVSKIQAGLRIVWPNITFKFEPISIPKIPRITPGANITIPQFKLLIPKIPVIPKPPELPHLPGLPALKLPKLPDLPPAPTIPNFPEEIQLVVDILKKIVKIYCIIKLGFVPTNESSLKTRIEQITARGLTPVLPIDTLFSITSPTINVDYVDQVVITGRTNLKMDFSKLREVVGDAAEQINTFTKGLTKSLNTYTDSFTKQLEKFTNFPLDLAPGEGQQLLNYAPEGRNPILKLQSNEDLLVTYGMQLRKIVKEMAREKTLREAMQTQIPESIVLEATEIPAPESAKDRLPIAEGDLILPFQKDLKAYRDELAQYVKASERMMAGAGAEEDIGALSRFLAQNKSPFEKGGFKRRLAEKMDRGMRDLGSGIRDQGSGMRSVSEKQWFGELNFEGMDWLGTLVPTQTMRRSRNLISQAPTDIFSNDARFLALSMPSPPDLSAMAPGLDPYAQARPRNVGLYFVDSDGQSKRLIDYTLEAESEAFLTSIDVDKDDDMDMAYSYGNNVYLKKNAQNEEEDKRPVFRDVDIEIWTVSELLPFGTSASFPKTLSETSRESSFEFASSRMKNIAGFEVLAYASPLYFEEAGAASSSFRQAMRLHLLPENKPAEGAEEEELAPIPVIASVSAMIGRAQFTGKKRDIIQSASGKVHVSAGESLHALEDAEVIFDADGPTEKNLKLEPSQIVTIPDFYTEGLEIEMEDGAIEIIRKAKGKQPVSAGMALFYGDRIEVQLGSVSVHYPQGGGHTIRFDEIYRLERTESLENPAANVPLDPGFYFGKIYSFDNEGYRSSASEKMLLAPQVCGDNTPPLANFGKAKFQVAVGKTLELDARKSFDTDGPVISYALDTDSDGEPEFEGDSPRFKIGPYEEVGTHQMRLTVKDEALNPGIQDITVEVITPRIVLEAPPLRSNIIAGYVEPREANVPIAIAKLRPGSGSGWELFTTGSANSNGQYLTNADGKFRIEDADLRDRLVIKNSEGQVIAEVNEETGRITALDDRYEARLLLASPPDVPMRIGLFLKTDTASAAPLTYVYFVPDVNTDATIDAPQIAYDAKAVRNMSGVHVKPMEKALQDGIGFRVLPADDEQVPGAAIVEIHGERVLTADVNGDMYFTNPDMALKLKQTTLPPEEALKSKDPVVFEMVYKNEVIAEVLIVSHPGASGRAAIVNEPAVAERPKPVPREKPADQPFTDISPFDAFAATAENLFKRGIIAGYPTTAAGELLFKPQNRINRAEFTQIVIKMLCIVPREEAHRLPSPFYDVIDPGVWFYPILKEGHIRKFISGYLGEPRIGEDGVTRVPFKPGNNITRAEASVIVIAALVEENIIDISKVDFTPRESGGNWYDLYIHIAQDLTPYLKNAEDKKLRPFLITPEEARLADEQITRKDFAIMAERVLLMYDCYNPDNDRDGLPDSWEQKYSGPEKDIEKFLPTDDLDGDACTNAQEYELGTDPLKADTDNGGVMDCEEMNRGTDPVKNPYDDRPLPSPAKVTNEEGIYVLNPDCGNVCPCRAAVGSGADLEPDDTIFAAISGPQGIPIYAKSNEEKY